MGQGFLESSPLIELSAGCVSKYLDMNLIESLLNHSSKFPKIFPLIMHFYYLGSWGKMQSELTPWDIADCLSPVGEFCRLIFRDVEVYANERFFSNTISFRRETYEEFCRWKLFFIRKMQLLVNCLFVNSLVIKKVLIPATLLFFFFLHSCGFCDHQTNLYCITEIQ